MQNLVFEAIMTRRDAKEAKTQSLVRIHCFTELEVSAALRMTAVAIDFNSVANTLARSAAIFTIMRGATTHGILTSLFLVCHGDPPELFERFGRID